MTTERSLSPIRALLIYGTRPEAIKMAPIVLAMKDADDFVPIVAVTGQHREMLDSVNELFGISPDRDLDIFEHGMGLSEISSRVLQRCEAVFSEMKPDVTLVQGDTTTSTFAGLASFYAGVPVVHVEAGLRSGDIRDPFPEELNRQLTSRLADLHLAPTATSAQNLLGEGIPADRVVVTGNTVIDALHEVIARTKSEQSNTSREQGRTLLVTAHRRENWGGRMDGIAQAIATLARRYDDLRIVVPMHRNPIVRRSLEPVLAELPAVELIEPLDYVDFTALMADSDIVLTDSGGVQEEAPSLGKPVLVMRETTERPEAVAFGTVKLIGTDTNDIVTEVSDLLDNPVAYEAMSRAVNPYGDGTASRRTLDGVRYLVGDADKPTDFAPTA
ncbi:non-hydrolyzing UDP-N-acetylglucosamine 2-epimerase [Dermacoccus nishinomiyaensis]|uniref:non-hydrolyzing UDP-N-acetylglucosamine 2-epimerase n=1 Tax=Dermacoccus nishinomiyaensis TaxID=1274 RepID=UPI00093DCE19|nr:UDP-N-acetylglucosamine 2-epimerase (non-hydrolyzing) [Dermacoccus nishinomiyaensis]